MIWPRKVGSMAMDLTQHFTALYKDEEGIHEDGSMLRTFHTKLAQPRYLRNDAMSSSISKCL